MAQLGNTDRVLRVVQRQNRVVTVSTMPNGPNGKDRFGPGGQEFARFKIGTYTTKATGDTVSCAVPLDATESKPKAPGGCPPEFQDAWLALDAAGASDGIARADLVELLGSLAKAAVKQGTGPDAVRKRRKRLIDGLLSAGLLVEGEGDMFTLRDDR